VPLAWQGTLFDPEGGREPERDPALSFDRVHRTHLDDRSWVDVVESWLPGHDALFDRLLVEAPWQQRERWMYERKVLEPRLVAAWSGETLSALPSQIAAIRAAVSQQYRVDFDSVLVNLYRDGRDGVAWHGDTVRKRMGEAVVVRVGLGERRRFLLRPGDHGPATLTLRTGEGDLVVMGGRCQTDWQHTVPKEKHAGARMSITMRHSRPLPQP
jgi:alkylated DNA repair dioxygenase AlkB